MSTALIDELVPGEAGFILGRYMKSHPSRYPISRWWTLHGHLRSFQWSGCRTIVKIRDGFDAHHSRADFSELIRESSDNGVPRPSSYASLYWRAPDRPKLPWPRNVWRKWGLTFVPGAWQEAFGPRGSREGSWVHYDIRSAYLWAVSLGLPDSSTYRFTHPRHDRDHKEAVYLCEFAPGDHPQPYARGGTYLATLQEMGEYGLEPLEVYGGIRWQGTSESYDTGPIVRDILRWSCWKAIARSWWGYFAARTGAKCHFPDREPLELAPYLTDPVWAHIIIGRVRRRLWEIWRDHREDLLRVYVDSIVVRDTVPISIGEKIGDWREEARYAHGVTVQSAVHIQGETNNA